MKRYPALVYRDDVGGLSATFPDLPGCLAEADTWGSLPYAASQALNLWFEDMPEVYPSSLDALRNQPSVAREISKGAVLLMLPMISKPNKN